MHVPPLPTWPCYNLDPYPSSTLEHQQLASLQGSSPILLAVSLSIYVLIEIKCLSSEKYPWNNSLVCGPPFQCSAHEHYKIARLSSWFTNHSWQCFSCVPLTCTTTFYLLSWRVHKLRVILGGTSCLGGVWPLVPLAIILPALTLFSFFAKFTYVLLAWSSHICVSSYSSFPLRSLRGLGWSCIIGDCSYILCTL